MQKFMPCSPLDFWFALEKNSQQATKHWRAEGSQKSLGQCHARGAKRIDESCCSCAMGFKKRRTRKEFRRIRTGKNTLEKTESRGAPPGNGEGTKRPQRAKIQAGLSFPRYAAPSGRIKGQFQKIDRLICASKMKRTICCRRLISTFRSHGKMASTKRDTARHLESSCFAIVAADSHDIGLYK